VEAGLRQDIVIHVDGLLRFGSRLCVPSGEVRRELLSEAHSSPYSVHPRGIKMYRDLKQYFWWHKMKREREIAQFVAIVLYANKSMGTLEDGGAISTTPYS